MYKNGFGIKSPTVVDVPLNQTKRIFYNRLFYEKSVKIHRFNSENVFILKLNVNFIYCLCCVGWAYRIRRLHLIHRLYKTTCWPWVATHNT